MLCVYLCLPDDDCAGAGRGVIEILGVVDAGGVFGIVGEAAGLDTGEPALSEEESALSVLVVAEVCPPPSLAKRRARI